MSSTEPDQDVTAALGAALAAPLRKRRTDADMFTPHDDSHVWAGTECWTCYLTGRITEREEASPPPPAAGTREAP